MKKSSSGRTLPKFRRGDRVSWRPRSKAFSGLIPDRFYHGTVEGQPKSGSRSSVWVRFDTPVTGAGTRLFLTPVAGLNKLKRRQ